MASARTLSRTFRARLAAAGSPLLIGAILCAGLWRALQTLALPYDHVVGALAPLLALTGLGAIALEPLGACPRGGWRALAAVAVSLATGAAVFHAIGLYAAYEAAFNLAPFAWIAPALVAFAARASASGRPLAGMRALFSCAVALLALGAFAEHSQFLGPPPHEPIDRVRLLAILVSDGSSAACWFDALAGGCLLLAASRGRPTLRALLAASGAACLGACVVRAFDAHAAGRLVADARDHALMWDDFSALGPVANIAVDAETLVGLLVGSVGVLAVRRAVRNSVSARHAWCMVLPIVVIGSWLLSPGADAELWRRLDMGGPAVWRTHGVQPAVREGPLGFPFRFHSPLWVVDATGTLIARMDREVSPHHEPLRILADHRAPLARIASYARALPRPAYGLERAYLGLRSSGTQALDALAPIRSRFALVDALSRAGIWISLRVGSEAELADCARGWVPGCPSERCAVTLESIASEEPDTCEGQRRLVLDRIPQAATLGDIANVDEVFVIEREGDPRDEPTPAPVFVDLEPPAGHSPFGPTALFTLIVGLACLLARARIRWASRIPIGATLVSDARPVGEVTPPWLARSACDARIVLAESATYRTGGAPVALVTARSFARGLALTTLAILRAWSPGTAASVLIAIAIAVITSLH